MLLLYCSCYLNREWKAKRSNIVGTSSRYEAKMMTIGVIDRYCVGVVFIVGISLQIALKISYILANILSIIYACNIVVV